MINVPEPIRFRRINGSRLLDGAAVLAAVFFTVCMA
jgi:hypothetical protein